MSRLAKLLVPLASATLTVAIFDLLGYFLAPEPYTGFAPSYRNTRLLFPDSSAMPAMTRGYPRYYFWADNVLGFDIRPGAQAMAEVDKHPYQIFANQLGCFDKNELSDFQQSKEYFYFAGDSFTWGYASYESKFPTVWERNTGKMAAKCGVTHTGQLHQFEKFRRVVSEIGKFPKVVFVGFCLNDPANDLAHPHTTVIDGYQVDTAFLKDGVIVHPNVNSLKQVVENSIREMENTKVEWVGRLRTKVLVYSLSANLLKHGALALSHAVRSHPVSPPRAISNFGDQFYHIYPMDEIKTSYALDPRANVSKAAIQKWKRHAIDNSYKLVFLLIPLKTNFTDPDLFTQLKGWLDANEIEYVDFAQLFSQGGYKVEDLYWKVDGHWNENGNQVVGRLLSTMY